jgi:hypothetical protein
LEPEPDVGLAPALDLEDDVVDDSLFDSDLPFDDALLTFACAEGFDADSGFAVATLADVAAGTAEGTSAWATGATDVAAFTARVAGTAAG